MNPILSNCTCEEQFSDATGCSAFLIFDEDDHYHSPDKFQKHF